MLVAIVVSPVEHEIARDAQARANGNPNDGQESEQECADENEMWHRTPAGGFCCTQLQHFDPSKSRTPYPLVVIPRHPKSRVDLLILLCPLQYRASPQ